MPRFNNYPQSFSSVIKRKSDNLSSTITPPSQTTPFFVTIRLKTNNTIDSVFTNSDFQRGVTFSTADNVRLTNPKNGSIVTYYVRTSDGAWRNTTGGSATNQLIENNSVISIVRRSSTSKTFTLKETAKATTYTPF